jgi:hypothetical protein
MVRMASSLSVIFSSSNKLNSGFLFFNLFFVAVFILITGISRFESVVMFFCTFIPKGFMGGVFLFNCEIWDFSLFSSFGFSLWRRKFKIFTWPDKVSFAEMIF